MSRYFTRPRSSKPRADWIDDDRPLIPNLDVPEHEARETGLLDKYGDPIMCAPRPVGFGRMEEW